MCLTPTAELIAGDPAPTRTKVWKLVTSTRQPWFRDWHSPLTYRDGETYTETLDDIAGGRKRCWGDDKLAYFQGLHVLTEDPRDEEQESLNWVRDSLEECDGYPTTKGILLELEVSPENWVADDACSCEAVYSKFKVIGVAL